MKKFWLLTSEYPPVHGGGISTYCLYTARMLAERGCEITVFTQDHTVPFRKVEQEGNIRVVRFHPGQSKQDNNLGYEVQLSLEFSLVLEDFIRNEGAPDILETQEYMGIGYYTLLKKKLLYPEFQSVQMVVTMHAPSFLYFEYNRTPYYRLPEYWWGEMEKAVMNMADILISPSDYLVSELKERMSFNGPEPVRIFNPFRTSGETEIGQIREGDLVFFGKLTPQKGCIELFAYMKELWDNGFEHALRIVGGGSHFFYPEMCEMESFLKKKYKSYVESGKIIFEGNIPPAQLPQRLAQAQVIIVPSIVDNLPYAVIEAMDMGKTVLASLNSGHTELIANGKSGFLFDHTVKGDFARVLKTVLGLSESERTEIGKQAQEAAKAHLNFEKIFQEKMSLLNAPPVNSSSFPFNYTIQASEAESKPAVKDKLTVVVPYYNLGATLPDTIASLLKCPYPNLEIIIVDDGSTDELSIRKLAEIEAAFPVKVLQKENEGLSIARNFGAQAADGEYLAFLDADDTIEPEYYPKALEILAQYENVSFVGCWAQYFENNDAVWPTFNPEPPYLLVHNVINSSALIYKRDHFLSFGLNDEKMVYGMEDYDSVIGMVKNGARGLAIPEKWWNYRIRKNSMQQSFNPNKELFLYQLIARKHEAFFRQFASQVSLLLNSNGPGMKFDNPTIPIAGDAAFGRGWIRVMKHRLKKHPVLFRVGKKIYKTIKK